MHEPCDFLVGLIANPASASDVRRIMTGAANMQTAERVSIVLRILAGLAACGVDRVLMMPDRMGLRTMLTRSLRREQHPPLPRVDYMHLVPASTVADTRSAARQMEQTGVRVIIVLGGDGTHRAVVKACGEVPISGVSTGTNNAFPELREPTIVGLAAGLYATGQMPASAALVANKAIDVLVRHRDGTEIRDLALVDAVVSADRHVGARALWKPESLHAVYATYASPEAVGLSSIGGLLLPVGRREPGGLAVHIATDPGAAQFSLNVPLAPGMMRCVPIAGWQRMIAGTPMTPQIDQGTIALDGEREIAFGPGERISFTLRESAFRTIDVASCMARAASLGLFRRTSTPTT
ncbi:MAG: NAD(+)/NADH kinase [Rhodocyclaceae bacterium]|jgi:NAD+ kinase|nr:NAD(+)/NADH kinase [Rhodocyclaceae bacterium]